ncbi:chorismate mutase [Actinomadura rupiterrae]|uniref:chorismate mutase n=1 Tax=Actinomadura rupiterrae TaxID=559627 RepID=UPI0020A25CBD|nr:chorismate mutase [Actinomadura rupiterrae]MCP2338446.1 chorismate mutase [Actinomadura rupiterrae]
MSDQRVVPDVRVVKAGAAVFGSGVPAVAGALPLEVPADAVRCAAQDAAAASAALLASAGAVGEGRERAAMLAYAAREAGLPAIADAPDAQAAERAGRWADMLRLTAPGPYLAKVVAATGLPVLLTPSSGPASGDEAPRAPDGHGAEPLQEVAESDPAADDGPAARRGAAGEWDPVGEVVEGADWLAAAGVSDIAVAVRAADLARAWEARLATGRPVVLDLRSPRVDAALLPALVRAVTGLGLDGLLVGLADPAEPGSGIAPDDVPGLSAVLPMLALAPHDAAGSAASAEEDGLAALRERLKLLDEQFVRLIAQRREVARLVGVIKRRARIPVRDLRQEVRVLDRAERLARGLDADRRTVVTIFNLLIDDAVAVQCAAGVPVRVEAKHP